MNLKLGAERNKILILAGLLIVAAYFFFSGESDEGRPAGRAAAPAASAPQAAAPAARTAAPAAANIRRAPARASGRLGLAASSEFKPSLKPKRPEDRPDPATVDPTLRLDLLAKVQQVEVQGGDRSLFDFSAPPPPKVVGPPEAKIHARTAPVKSPGGMPVMPGGPMGAAPPVKPTAPPIPLKFYGFLNQIRQGTRRAFFLAGDDIFVANEGDLIQKRYKVVRINANSAVLEDTQFKSQQTLTLEEHPG